MKSQSLLNQVNGSHASEVRSLGCEAFRRNPFLIRSTDLTPETFTKKLSRSQCRNPFLIRSTDLTIQIPKRLRESAMSQSLLNQVNGSHGILQQGRSFGGSRNPFLIRSTDLTITALEYWMDGHCRNPFLIRSTDLTRCSNWIVGCHD